MWRKSAENDIGHPSFTLTKSYSYDVPDGRKDFLTVEEKRRSARRVRYDRLLRLVLCNKLLNVLMLGWCLIFGYEESSKLVSQFQHF